MKQKIKLYSLIAMGFGLMLSDSCSKDGNGNNNIAPTGPVPVLTTSAVTVLTPTTASCGGNITSDGGSTVIARGVCWSTNTTPTITDSKTTDGTGAGTFTSSITGLSLNNTYYVRAYATNSSGTGYGSALSFTNKLAIGQSYQGGIIAYIILPSDSGYDANVIHGIIAAPNDQSTSIQWYQNTDSYKTGATGITLGTGYPNTKTIVNSQGTGATQNYAAKLCYDLVLGGYDDWYLPSQTELLMLCYNKDAIGGFTNDYYWSSTELNGMQVFVMLETDCSFTLSYKASYHRVRAIRSF